MRNEKSMSISLDIKAVKTKITKDCISNLPAKFIKSFTYEITYKSLLSIRVSERSIDYVVFVVLFFGGGRIG